MADADAPKRTSMNIIVTPTDHKELNRAYRHAITHAKELYIASAFLTDWVSRAPLNKSCRKLLILVGTDFGLTRKKACKQVLSWMPRNFAGGFLAVPVYASGHFHPKVITWKEESEKYFALIGSSNLTSAGFSTNVEANVKARISRLEYRRLVAWMESIAEESQVVTSEWIDQYKESRWTKRKRGIHRVISLQIPSGRSYALRIRRRRKAEKYFPEIAGSLRKAIVACARREISNREFWSTFWPLWAHHVSRMQGSGLQFTGKSANWHQACKSMAKILDRAGRVTDFDLDDIVRVELDSLQRAANPVRGAWFTEMLCHFLPDKYPLVNNPVKRWLASKRWKATSGVSYGSEYVELSRKLRDAIRQNTNGPRNFPELDAAIWLVHYRSW